MPTLIPYGAYWSTPFARWQGSLSHLHAVEFAAHTAKAALAEREIPPEVLDFAAFGNTVIQKSCFYGTPWFTGMMGAPHVAGPTVTQACATGARLLATAAGELATGGASVALIASGDRTSNGPHVYYPAPQGPGGTGAAEDWVMDNFNRDPLARCAMVDTAENVARREGIDTAEQHEVVLHRAAQYADALADGRAFQRRYMAGAFEVPDARFRKAVAVLEGDEGVYPTSPEKISSLRPVREGGTVTFAGQTHPADGNAGMIVVGDAARAAELARDAAVTVEVLGFGQGREDVGYMPAAPIAAARRALAAAGLEIGQIDAIKSHNPFAVNDIAFARAFGIDWREMNNFGCSLVWGHPQGPTALRLMIELIEELALRGGGRGLFHGCAAGDSAMAVVLRVG